MAHPTQAKPPLTVVELRGALSAAFPGAVLVPTWVLREVIIHDRPEGAGLFVPRQRIHVIARERAAALARQQRLPIDGRPADQDCLALLPEPDRDWLASTPAALALRHYWRLLFRARVFAEMRCKLGLAGASPAELDCGSVLRQFDRLGCARLHEIRQVLQEERLLRAGTGDAEVCADFVVMFLELFYFDRPMLRRFFPMVPVPSTGSTGSMGLTDSSDSTDSTSSPHADSLQAGSGNASVLTCIAQAIDAESLWRQTRLAGAADPPAAEPAGALHDETAEPMPAFQPPDEAGPTDREPSGSASRRNQEALFAAADRAAARGNDVRAAILHTQAFQLGGTRAGVNHAGRDLEALAKRLASVREIGRVTAAEWRQALRPLLAPVAHGWWNHQARLLYDLQKVCINNEREVFSVNLVEWALDLGRRPLRRPLPQQRLVLIVKHLHSAQGRLTRMHLGAAVRPKLTEALGTAVHAAESSLHQQLYPIVLSALQASGLEPNCHTEVVAQNKLVEELLDIVVRKGFLSLGDLRDAISRNAMKLDDLRGPREFVRGDQLLRIDRKLAIELDGIYRRGEVYRRWFQRISSLLYADRIGRIVTRTLLIPFGGAVLVLEGLEHTIGLVIHLIFKVHADLGVGFHLLPKPGKPIRGWKFPGLNWRIDHPYRYLAVAALFFLLTNWPAFRAAAGHMLRKTGRAWRWLFVDFPAWAMSRPILRAIARSKALRVGIHYLIEPLLLASLAWLVLPRWLSVMQRAALGGGAFVAASLLLNSRRIRLLEGALFHRLRIGWEKLTGNILTGLYHMVMGFFEVVLEDVDRMLYQVDEWLRFRSGQRKAALVAKALLGVCWFYAAYFVRFVINLMIEPQLNPIKHFPVVTVTAKMLMTQINGINDALVAHGLAHAHAKLITATIVSGVPGMAGFLAWESLSNWKLYKANRPPALGPVQVGSHGESVARLLRPGIHSGTIPKIFARLRRAAGGRRSGRRTQKHLHALEHVREAVHNFLERELIARLNRHPAWKGTPIALGEVTLTPSSIVAELLCPTQGRPGPGPLLDAGEGSLDRFSGAGPMRISFRNWSGWIVAGIDEIGWAAALSQHSDSGPSTEFSTPRGALLSLALAGLYKLAGVDLVREQADWVLAAAFGLDAGGGSLRWDVRGDELLVWLDGRQEFKRRDAASMVDPASRRASSAEFEAAYALAEGAVQPTILAARKNGVAMSGRSALPSIDSAKLMLRHMPIGWEAWLNAWEPAAGPAARVAALNGVRVLPEVSTPDLAPIGTM